MTDFTNGSTNPASNTANEDSTNFTGQTVKPEGSTNPNQDNGVVLEFNGRKFTKEDLIKKLSSADDFIETLKKEREEDRALLNQVQDALKEQVTAKELLNQIKAGGDQKPTTAVDPKDIAAQVMAQLATQQAATKQEANWAEVTTQLTAAFGDKTNAKVKAVAEENGLSIEEAARMARTNPKVFLKLFPELSNKGPMGNNLVSGNSGNVLGNKAPKEAPKNTGFTKANTTKERVNIYLKRIQELSGN